MYTMYLIERCSITCWLPGHSRQCDVGDSGPDSTPLHLRHTWCGGIGDCDLVAHVRCDRAQLDLAGDG